MLPPLSLHTLCLFVLLGVAGMAFLASAPGLHLPQWSCITATTSPEFNRALCQIGRVLEMPVSEVLVGFGIR